MTGTGGVRLEGVRKRYPGSGRWVLDGIDALLASGAVTVVVGGNGSGKSTLLRTVVGVSRPTRGRVLRPAGPAAYVPERLPTGIRLTALEYVSHMGRMRGLDAVRVSRRAHELFDRLELRPGPQAPVGELSKGNSQKVALTQALLEPTRLLVVDEPFSGLDPRTERTVDALAREARAAGTAVLLSGHDPALFPDADALLLLADGRVTAGVPTVWPARSRLVLRRRDEGAAPGAIAALPGVAEPRWDPEQGVLELVTTDPDLVLRQALAGGWSFVRGAPDRAPAGRGTP